MDRGDAAHERRDGEPHGSVDRPRAGRLAPRRVGGYAQERWRTGRSTTAEKPEASGSTRSSSPIRRTTPCGRGSPSTTAASCTSPGSTSGDVRADLLPPARPGEAGRARSPSQTSAARTTIRASTSPAGKSFSRTGTRTSPISTRRYFSGEASAGVWRSPTRISNGDAASDLSSPASSPEPNADLHLAWVDSRDGNQEIYYREYIDPANGVAATAAKRRTRRSPSSIDVMPESVQRLDERRALRAGRVRGEHRISTTSTDAA